MNQPPSTSQVATRNAAVLVVFAMSCASPPEESAPTPNGPASSSVTVSSHDECCRKAGPLSLLSDQAGFCLCPEGDADCDRCLVSDPTCVASDEACGASARCAPELGFRCVGEVLFPPQSDGTCAPPTTQVDRPSGPLCKASDWPWRCVADGDCPIGAHCSHADGGVCTFSCLPPDTCAEAGNCCAAGSICDCNGRCVTPGDGAINPTTVIPSVEMSPSAISVDLSATGGLARRFFVDVSGWDSAGETSADRLDIIAEAGLQLRCAVSTGGAEVAYSTSIPAFQRCSFSRPQDGENLRVVAFAEPVPTLNVGGTRAFHLYARLSVAGLLVEDQATETLFVGSGATPSTSLDGRYTGSMTLEEIAFPEGTSNAALVDFKTRWNALDIPLEAEVLTQDVVLSSPSYSGTAASILFRDTARVLGAGRSFIRQFLGVVGTDGRERDLPVAGTPHLLWKSLTAQLADAPRQVSTSPSHRAGAIGWNQSSGGLSGVFHVRLDEWADSNGASPELTFRFRLTRQGPRTSTSHASEESMATAASTSSPWLSAIGEAFQASSVGGWASLLSDAANGGLSGCALKLGTEQSPFAKVCEQGLGSLLVSHGVGGTAADACAAILTGVQDVYFNSAPPFAPTIFPQLFVPCVGAAGAAESNGLLPACSDTACSNEFSLSIPTSSGDIPVSFCRIDGVTADPRYGAPTTWPAWRSFHAQSCAHRLISAGTSALSGQMVERRGPGPHAGSHDLPYLTSQGVATSLSSLGLIYALDNTSSAATGSGLLGQSCAVDLGRAPPPVTATSSVAAQVARVFSTSGCIDVAAITAAIASLGTADLPLDATSSVTLIRRVEQLMSATVFAGSYIDAQVSSGLMLGAGPNPIPSLASPQSAARLMTRAANRLVDPWLVQLLNRVSPAAWATPDYRCSMGAQDAHAIGDLRGPLFELTTILNRMRPWLHGAAMAPSNAFNTSSDGDAGAESLALRDAVTWLQALGVMLQRRTEAAVLALPTASRAGPCVAQWRIQNRDISTAPWRDPQAGQSALTVTSSATAAQAVLGIDPSINVFESFFAQFGTLLMSISTLLVDDYLPIYFADVAGVNSKFFATSDYALNQWARPAVQEAKAAIENLRSTYQGVLDRQLSQVQSSDQLDRDLQAIEDRYGGAVARACGMDYAEWTYQTAPDPSCLSGQPCPDIQVPSGTESTRSVHDVFQDFVACEVPPISTSPASKCWLRTSRVAYDEVVDGTTRPVTCAQMMNSVWKAIRPLSESDAPACATFDRTKVQNFRALMCTMAALVAQRKMSANQFESRFREECPVSTGSDAIWGVGCYRDFDISGWPKPDTDGHKPFLFGEIDPVVFGSDELKQVPGEWETPGWTAPPNTLEYVLKVLSDEILRVNDTPVRSPATDLAEAAASENEPRENGFPGPSVAEGHINSISYAAVDTSYSGHGKLVPDEIWTGLSDPIQWSKAYFGISTESSSDLTKPLYPALNALTLRCDGELEIVGDPNSKMKLPVDSTTWTGWMSVNLNSCSWPDASENLSSVWKPGELFESAANGGPNLFSRLHALLRVAQIPNQVSVTGGDLLEQMGFGMPIQLTAAGQTFSAFTSIASDTEAKASTLPAGSPIAQLVSHVGGRHVGYIPELHCCDLDPDVQLAHCKERVAHSGMYGVDATKDAKLQWLIALCNAGVGAEGCPAYLYGRQLASVYETCRDIVQEDDFSNFQAIAPRSLGANASAIAACLQGDLGSAYNQILSAYSRATAAETNVRVLTNTIYAQSRLCQSVQRAGSDVQTIYADMADFAEQMDQFSNGMGAAMGAVSAVAGGMLSGTGWGAVSGAASLVQSAASSAMGSASAANVRFQAAMEKVRQGLAEKQCFIEVTKMKYQMDSNIDAMKSAVLDAVQALVAFQNVQSELERNVQDGQSAYRQWKSRRAMVYGDAPGGDYCGGAPNHGPAIDPTVGLTAPHNGFANQAYLMASQDFYADAEATAAKVRWALRTLRIARRALEHEAQQSVDLNDQHLNELLSWLEEGKSTGQQLDSPYWTGLSDRTTHFHPQQLDAAVNALDVAIATRTVNGARPEDTTVVRSVRDDLLGLADRSGDPSACPTEGVCTNCVGTRALTSAERLQAALRDPKNAVFDGNGAYLGQGLRFALAPEGELAYRCAERLWSVNASLEGDFLSGAVPRLPVMLLKENTFQSQWCGASPDGSERQSGKWQPFVNHFASGGTEDIRLVGDDGYTWSQIDAWVNVRRSDFYKEGYAEGASSELAGRGLYGGYMLLIPWKGFLDRDPTVLNRLEDILLRFDIVSVANGSAAVTSTPSTGDAAPLTPTKASGAPCAYDAQCTSGYCTDHVCCESRCAGGCESCDRPSLLGECTKVDVGTGTTSCGGYAFCGFEGGCPETCSTDGECRAPSYCNESSHCVPPCAEDADCSLGYWCDSATTRCTAALGLGAACSRATQCGSGQCAVDRCCSEACGAPCEACSSNGIGCTAYVDGAADEDCAPYLCDGTVGCPASCEGNSDCSNNGKCHGAPAGRCGPACTSDVSCHPNEYCAADGRCEVTRSPGSACSRNAECATSVCVGRTVSGTFSGTCCTFSCDGCELCDSDGDGCVPLAVGTADPTCTGYACTGLGGCPSQCGEDANCADGYYCQVSTSTCVQLAALGAACEGGHACAEGRPCIDNVCCASPACGDGTTTCQTGYCEVGTGQCVFLSGVSCSSASCAGSTLTEPRLCDGQGGCGNPSSAPCPGGFLCASATACATSCAAAVDCQLGFYCAAGSCVARVQVGESCSNDDMCVSNACASSVCVPCREGHCCPEGCNGACSVCASTGGGCVGATVGTVDARCGAYLCDGAESCPDTCTLSEDCAAGQLCQFVPAVGCAPTCTTDADCGAGNWCDVMTGYCQEASAAGSWCDSSAHCETGTCAAGRCCPTACAGPCSTCNSAGDTCEPVVQGSTCAAAACSGSTFTGASQCDGTGTCDTPMSALCANGYTCASASSCRTSCATDAECQDTYYCSGSACTPRLGVGDACSSNAMCLSNACVSDVCAAP